MSIQAYHLFLRVFPIYKGCWWGCTTFMFFKSFKNRLQKKTRIPLKCFQDSASILLEFYLIYSSIFYFKTSIKSSCNQMDDVCVGSVISDSCVSLGHSPPGSAIHGISGVVAISYSMGSPRSRDWTHISCIFCTNRWILYHWATWKWSESEVT